MLHPLAGWQWDALISRLMAAQCLDIAPDGGAMLGYCPQWLAGEMSESKRLMEQHLRREELEGELFKQELCSNRI
jgi:hypothetical protein